MIRNVSVLSVKFIFWVLKPTKENSSVPLVSGSERENHPLLLVAVPRLISVSLTVTPGMGSFFLS